MSMQRLSIFGALVLLGSFCTSGAGNAQAVPLSQKPAAAIGEGTVTKVHATRRHHKRHLYRHYDHRHGDHTVDAPFAYVESGRHTYVDAPFTEVYVGRRGRRVIAPFVDLWIPN